MPNKKARRKHEHSSLAENDFDLPPSQLTSAKSRRNKRKLASKPNNNNSSSSDKPPKKSWELQDDTPKAFARMMAIKTGAVKARSGLDEGRKRGKKRGIDEVDKADNGDKTKKKEALKIEPGESMRAFSRRVDEAIPIKFPKGSGEPTSRAAIAAKRRKAKAAAAAATAEEQPTNLGESDLEASESEREEEGKVDYLYNPEDYVTRKKGGKKGKRDASPDPWKDLEKKREKVKFGEVAKAPPKLERPREVFRARVVDVPKAAGSLAKREGLAREREEVVEKYREMMKGRKTKEAV